MENLKFPMQERRCMPPPSADGFPFGGDTQQDTKISKAMEQHRWLLFLQKLQEGKPEDIQTIFSEVKDYTCKLMFDPSGSEVILKLFQVCDEERKKQLVFSLTADAQLFISLCLHSQGCESLKKFLGVMTPNQVSHIMNVFSYFTVPLVNHQIGCQVIHHCFKIFPANQTQPILEVIDRYCLEIAVDQNGSALLQVLISGDYLKGGPLYRIVSTLWSMSYNLSRNEFGTCVIQHLIGLEIPHLLERLMDRLQGSFALMWKDEPARIVLKKLMGASKKKYAPQIIEDMITSPHFLAVLLQNRDPFLLQFAKIYAKGTTRKILNDLICQYSQLLRIK
ncbi:pumilio homolog 12-like isoform X2 [Henckelia pumila]|uniref:pumilio homolog 12-like isoform X2 n=1 Tax=Henckelia pumila TaxID=405737 RepID=UPI003C6DBE12